MKKLTVDETIQHAHQLWTHIAKTGDTKSQAKAYLVCTEDQQHLKYLGFVNSYCSFCAYAGDHSRTQTDFCKYCPASGMWVDGDPTATCEDRDSPYSSDVMMFGDASERRIVGAEMTNLIKKVAAKHNVNL